MDWPSDNACLSRNDVMLRRIFKYNSRPSRVVRIVSKNQVCDYFYSDTFLLTERYSIEPRYGP